MNEEMKKGKEAWSEDQLLELGFPMDQIGHMREVKGGAGLVRVDPFSRNQTKVVPIGH